MRATPQQVDSSELECCIRAGSNGGGICASARYSTTKITPPRINFHGIGHGLREAHGATIFFFIIAISELLAHDPLGVWR
jgi:hypothetical protein